MFSLCEKIVDLFFAFFVIALKTCGWNLLCVCNLYVHTCIFLYVCKDKKEVIRVGPFVFFFIFEALKMLFLFSFIATFMLPLISTLGKVSSLFFVAFFFWRIFTFERYFLLKENNYVWWFFKGGALSRNPFSFLNFKGDIIRNRCPPSRNNGGKENEKMY